LINFSSLVESQSTLRFLGSLKICCSNVHEVDAAGALAGAAAAALFPKT